MKHPVGIVMCLLASTMQAHPQGQDTPPKLTGKYRCQPDPRDCLLGQTFNVTQSGGRVEISNDKDEALLARVTSATFLTMGAPWNALGVIYGSDIQWFNGTRWVKTE